MIGSHSHKEQDVVTECLHCTLARSTHSEQCSPRMKFRCATRREGPLEAPGAHPSPACPATLTSQAPVGFNATAQVVLMMHLPERDVISFSRTEGEGT